MSSQIVSYDHNCLGLIVNVRRQWNGSDGASYRLQDISGFRWSSVSGGVRRGSPHSSLYAEVDCQGMIDGHLNHSGTHGPCPHSIKVCIVKADNDKRTYAQLLKMAPPKPKLPRILGASARRTIAGKLICEKLQSKELCPKFTVKDILQEKWEDLGYHNQVVATLKRLIERGVVKSLDQDSDNNPVYEWTGLPCKKSRPVKKKGIA